ncbi:hypothetical protein QYM36_005706 [Artemia franciscana]|uniref:Uncharacterized protein n=1 Tax=Artemia franciscana TaxID=6661 RepID=A0AA88LA07_ARTSF|nr:hypothetical protein QYM36_005706 [Artemia franciscana]
MKHKTRDLCELPTIAESAQQSENLVEHKKKSSEGHWLKETFETFKETVETIKEETVETIKETLETCKNKAILWAKDEIFIRLQKKLLEANYSITNENIRRDICHLLISYGAEVNATDEHCNRPVDIAKNQKNFHLIQYLLHNGASLFYNLDNNEPAFASAMKHKTRDLCELPTIAESAQQSENLVEHKKKSSEGHWLKETFETFKETVETIKEETVETIKETLETCKNKAILWAKDEIFIRLQKKLLEANYSITNVNISRDICDLLTGNEAEIDIFDEADETPLYNEFVSLEEHLIGVKNSKTYGVAPLSPTGRRDICHLLISYGAEVNATDEHCNRPVDIAKNQKNFHLIQYLLHNGASLFYNLDNNEPAFASAMKHKTRDLCELPTIGNLPVVFTYQDTLFLEAVKAYCFPKNKVEEYLKKGQNPNYDHCLYLAVLNEITKLVDMLIKYGPELDILNSEKEIVFLWISL